MVHPGFETPGQASIFLGRTGLSVEGGEEKYTVDLPEEQQKIILYVAVFFLSLVFLTVGLLGVPLLSSVSVDLLIVAYALLLSFAPDLTILAVAPMVAVHAGSIISYYGHPLVLPFIVIERHGEFSSAGIDIVQIIVAYEIARWLLSKRKTENTKTPIGEGKEQGAAVEPPR